MGVFQLGFTWQFDRLHWEEATLHWAIIDDINKSYEQMLLWQMVVVVVSVVADGGCGWQCCG